MTWTTALGESSGPGGCRWEQRSEAWSPSPDTQLGGVTPATSTERNEVWHPPPDKQADGVTPATGTERNEVWRPSPD